LAAEVEKLATHKKNGGPYNPRYPSAFVALTAYRATKEIPEAVIPSLGHDSGKSTL
tara:strand:- start:25016 stop:25183 length:168 start_codon:yes stop_codon:yes gene_type:complete